MGLMLLGSAPAVAIGTTTLAEGVISLSGLLSYQLILGLEWPLAITMTAGSMCADPISARLANYLKLRWPRERFARLISLTMIILGIATTLRLLNLL